MIRKILVVFSYAMFFP